jgi:hypothetical protein
VGRRPPRARWRALTGSRGGRPLAYPYSRSAGSSTRPRIRRLLGVGGLAGCLLNRRDLSHRLSRCWGRRPVSCVVCARSWEEQPCRGRGEHRQAERWRSTASSTSWMTVCVCGLRRSNARQALTGREPQAPRHHDKDLVRSCRSACGPGTLQDVQTAGVLVFPAMSVATETGRAQWVEATGSS